MLITVHLAHPQFPLQIQGDLPEDEAETIATCLENGEWVTMTFPPGSPDRVRVNPAWVTHVQLVS
jgi:hypothetical protein